MTFDLTFKINGLEGLIDRLHKLPDKLQKSGARKATRKAANVVRNAARAKARQLDDPQTAENIAKNIVTQESGRQGKREGGIVMRVGVMGGAGRYNTVAKGRKRRKAPRPRSSNPGGDTRYWRHIEFGTEHVKADPFMRPALENNIGVVTDVLVRELNVELDKLTPNVPAA